MGRRSKVVLAAACAAVLATSFGVADAQASPDSWPADNPDMAIILSCPGGELALLAPKGEGRFVPAQVAENSGVVFPPPGRLGHQVFIPYRVYFELKVYSRGTL